MPLAVGTVLGPYRIVAPVGAGGMGEVYKARDTRLDRDVAVKISAKGFGERFHREARTIASLNHPHICTLHDVGQQNGVEYLVMEYIEGRSLAGPLPPAEVIRLGGQIAQALEAAHRKGITHRDLKPGNVLVTKAGVKLLDFGLAKVGREKIGEDQETRSEPLSGEGMLLGTLPYMAPEQVEGKDADARTDIFALGLVLYEMATGRRAFEGKSRASLTAAILERDPEPLSRLQPQSPPALERIVARCLAKDPDDRWQSAADVKWQLESVTAEAPRQARRRERLPWWIAAAAVAVAAALGIAIGLRRTETAAVPVYSSFVPPEGTVIAPVGIALSPDGRHLVFAANTAGQRQLWLRALDTGQMTLLKGTEDASYPFWSPDSKSIAFYSGLSLKRLEVSGGLPRVICTSLFGRGGAWSTRGVILFSPRQGTALLRVSASGGDPEPLTKLNEGASDVSHVFPEFLPDGNHFLYFAQNGEIKRSAIVLASLDGLARGDPGKRLLVSEFRAVFARRNSSGNGFLLTAKDGTLFSYGLSPSSALLDRDPIPTAATGAFATGPTPGFAGIAATTGVLAFHSGGAPNQLVLADRGGVTLRLFPAADEYTTPRISPDQREAFVAKLDSANQNVSLWVVDLERSTERRVTFDAGRQFYALWSPDGRRLVFSQTGKVGIPTLFMRPVSGDAEAAQITERSVPQYPYDWSGDGNVLAYSQLDGNAAVQLWFLPLSGDRKPRPFLKSTHHTTLAQFMPEASGAPRWIAYTSNESGINQVYVQSLTERLEAGAVKHQVSASGGRQPRWRGDGKELFYLSSNSMITVVPVNRTGDRLEFGAPRELFRARIQSLVDTRFSYDVTKDGQRFLLVRELENTSANRINVIVNWQAALKQ